MEFHASMDNPSTIDVIIRQEEVRERNYGDSGGHYITHSSDYLSSDSKHYVKKRSGW